MDVTSLFVLCVTFHTGYVAVTFFTFAQPTHPRRVGFTLRNKNLKPRSES